MSKPKQNDDLSLSLSWPLFWCWWWWWCVVGGSRHDKVGLLQVQGWPLQHCCSSGMGEGGAIERLMESSISPSSVHPGLVGEGKREITRLLLLTNLLGWLPCPGGELLGKVRRENGNSLVGFTSTRRFPNRADQKGSTTTAELSPLPSLTHLGPVLRVTSVSDRGGEGRERPEVDFFFFFAWPGLLSGLETAAALLPAVSPHRHPKLAMKPCPARPPYSRARRCRRELFTLAARGTRRARCASVWCGAVWCVVWLAAACVWCGVSVKSVCESSRE